MVEVRRETCGGGPAGNTLIQRLLLGSGGEHCDLELAVDVRGGAEERRSGGAEEGGRRKEEGRRRKEEGGGRREEGGRRKEEACRLT